MSVKVAKSRFIVSSVTGFYQHLTRRVSSFQELGNYLVREAELAQAFRQTDKLKDLGSMLANLPLREHSVIGQYYLTWCEYRKGQNVQDKLEKIFEQTQTYKPKVLFSLAALVTNKGDVESSARHYLEALKLADNPSTFVGAVKGMAILKSMEGFKVSALRDLERISSIVKYANSKTYYDYLNSLAVEMSEAGRNDEAQNISSIVLASPYINAYPEYRDTGKDIALKGYKSRSAVQVIHSFLDPNNLVRLPVPEPKPRPTPTKRAKVFSYMDWKEKKAKESISQEFDRMTDKDLVIKIFELAAEDGMTWRKLRRIVDYIIKVHSEPY
jgi:hypothetical protein